jgi:hypothetical protein
MDNDRRQGAKRHTIAKSEEGSEEQGRVSLVGSNFEMQVRRQDAAN